jgi:hypothetical protein
MTKIAGSGSGSTSQRHGSANPDLDPPQNFMDLEHCLKQWQLAFSKEDYPTMFHPITISVKAIVYFPEVILVD